MIECIPNFSEGRRREVIDAIAAAISGVSGATVLDIHADADHNRSVITFAGESGAVGEAAFLAVRAAAALIDMNEQHGQHPRVGATDVLPFVPLAGTKLEQCVALARAVGQRIGEELAIPVYLYEAAAMRPDRIALPNLRRGEYEELRTAIERDPARAPDFGPARLGPAGATIVGARLPLIAYNIYLNTGDVRVAKRVAKAVRGSSGGLRGVRALGLLVNGRAQVSMNLIDYRTTPLHRAVELVAREAAAYGAAIVESELVGLIPEDALLDAARFYLRLHALREDQVLERRLAQVTNEERRKGTIYPAPTYPAPTNDEHPLCVVGRQWQQTTAMEDQMETSWKLMIEALGASAGELAAAGAGESQARTMLQALGRELLALAGQQADAAGARAAARALLLVAERAAKVAEIATGLSDSGGEAASAARLAQVIALGAQARATPLLPQLPDQELRANFAREFAAHARQSAEFVARVEPILPNPSP